MTNEAESMRYRRADVTGGTYFLHDQSGRTETNVTGGSH
jgi:hypothetical protein